MKLPEGLWIGRESGWRTEASGGRIELVDPATEEVWANVPAAGEKEIDETLTTAEEVFQRSGWAQRSSRERGEVLLEIARRIRAEAEVLAAIESRNAGKPLTSTGFEIEAAARCFEYYAGVIRGFGGETLPASAQGFDFTLRVPVGVVLAIVPWNFPLVIAAWKVAPALAVGNAVVLKPASLTPLSALHLGRIAVESGLPVGQLQVLCGRGGQIGDRLVTDRRVRKIAFTGETETGARILRLAADDVKRVSLELGGKSPNIIFADADLELAAKAGPMAVFDNTGQDCCARSRVLVEASVYDQVLEAFVERTRELVIGPPAAKSTELGPMVSQGQRASVESAIANAKQAGGRIVCGGTRPFERGFYLAPTVIDRLEPDHSLCQEEIFGPVVHFIPFRDEREAIALANGTRYGLSGSLWTRDLERALRVARVLETGVLSVNTNSSVYQEAPFGGFKQSGLGRELGLEALRHYTEVKNVFIRVSGLESPRGS